MADQNIATQPFDTALDPQIDQFIQEIEKQGVPVFDKEGKKKWIKEMLAKGFSLKMVQEKLKEYNYDFSTAKKYFDEMAANKEKAEKAITEVTKLKTEKVEEEKKKKFSSRLALTLTAFILGGVGFFTWNMFRKTSQGIGEGLDLMAGPAGGMMAGFTKGSLIVGIAGIGVGLFLTVFIVATRFKERVKKESKEEKKPVDKAQIEQKTKEMEKEISIAQQVSKEKLEPPKLVS